MQINYYYDYDYDYDYDCDYDYTTTTTTNDRQKVQFNRLITVFRLRRRMLSGLTTV